MGRRTQEFERTISIHALRKESDRPAREQRAGLRISIHALRKESDARKPLSSSLL